MTNDIPNALSREQWERYLRGENLNELFKTSVGADSPDEAQTTLHLEGHPLAALGLYEKSYGFDHFDVTLAKTGMSYANETNDGLRRKAFERLARKIEALLPPEDLLEQDR